MLEWASERSGRGFDELGEKFPRLAEWTSGTRGPTLKQLERFARATDTPIGFFFLPEPPKEELPVPDFRTRPGVDSGHASPNLLDTIYLCEQRQEWYRSYLIATGVGPLDFVGSLDTRTDVKEAARAMVGRLGFDLPARQEFSSWSEAFAQFREHAEDAGVLVMVSGVVGSNTHRKLDPDEFRGFALIDERAPVVFINGSDTRAAQIFTLAHELAHVWIGQPALSNARLDLRESDEATERWCSAVAAELLVPADSLTSTFSKEAPLRDELDRLAREYRVSTLVVLRRIYDTGYLSWERYRAAFDSELAQAREKAGAAGGNFYSTQPIRTSKRFARAVIADTLEGRTLYRDAFQLLGVRKQATFAELGKHLGVS